MESRLARAYAEIEAYAPDTDDLRRRFNPYHIEALLTQSSVLLDRVLADRKELQSLEAQQASLSLETITAKADLASEEARLAAGFYRLELASLDAADFSLQAAGDNIKNVSNEETDSKTKALLEGQYYGRLAELQKSRSEAAALRADFPNVENLAAAKADRARKLLEYSRTARGPFYYEGRINSLAARITRDFKDAVDRLDAAQAGINKIFPGLFAEVSPSPIGVDLDEIETRVARTRELLAHMAAIAQREQSFCVSVAVRKLVSTAAWDGSMADLAQQGECELSFSLPRTAIPVHSYGRLKGLGLTHGTPDRLLSAAISLPRTSGIWGRSAGQGALLPSDQRDLPPCYIGRVDWYGSSRPPEIAGTNSHANASPLSGAGANGNWRIELRWLGPELAQPRADVEALFLDLYVAILPRMMA